MARVVMFSLRRVASGLQEGNAARRTKFTTRKDPAAQGLPGQVVQDPTKGKIGVLWDGCYHRPADISLISDRPAYDPQFGDMILFLARKAVLPVWRMISRKPAAISWS